MGWRECMGDTLYTVMTTRASAVLTNYVLPKHSSFLFLWVGEICYFDILSNCEQSLLATFYDNNWTKCSCTFIIINNYMYLHFKLSLQFLDELEMSMFLCKKTNFMFIADSAQTEYCSTFPVSVRVSQAWHLTFLTYIKA